MIYRTVQDDMEGENKIGVENSDIERIEQKENKENKVKKLVVKIILIIILIMIFSTIFGFSNQNGEKSTSISRRITEFVTKNIESIQQLDGSEKEAKLLKIEHRIRKLAHFSIYTVLGISLMGLMMTYDMKMKARVLYSLVIGMFYAASDEIHQMFVAERTALVTDVIIDSCGVLVGIVIVRLCVRLVRKMKTKK